MSFTIRPYFKADFDTLDSWWRASGEQGPLESMIPRDTTWILEIDKRPALAVSVIRTNVTEYCYVENFVGNPEFKGPLRREATLSLLQYIENFARAVGYRRLFCMAHLGPLKARYQEIGFTQTLDSVATFTKELV